MVCEQLLRPMPETCNGLDDNCSGFIDDLSFEWDDGEFAHLDAPQDYDHASCFGGDEGGVACTCTGPAEDLRLDHHVGRGDTAQEEFDAYVEEHVGGPAGCHCMPL